jgi:hypothetical protein
MKILGSRREELEMVVLEETGSKMTTNRLLEMEVVVVEEVQLILSGTRRK